MGGAALLEGMYDVNKGVLELELSTLTMSVLSMRDSIFYLVGNIPASFRSANLRAFFSQHAEKNAIACFHYKHRPEHLKEKCSESVVKVEGKEQLESTNEAEATSSHLEGSGQGSVTSKCCVVAVKSKFGTDFLKTYHNKNWAHHDGTLLVGKVRISKLDVSDQSDENEAGNLLSYLLWYGDYHGNIKHKTILKMAAIATVKLFYTCSV